VEPSAVVLTVIAQLTPWKAQDDAIRILSGLRDRGHDATLLLVGEAKFVARATRFDNIAFRRTLDLLVQDLGLSGHVRFLGQVEDVRDVLSASDVLLLPSWEEPLGRAVIEALAMGVPVMATTEGGPREIITDGRQGRLLPPKSPEEWIAALHTLLTTPQALEQMGREARPAVDPAFGVERHLDNMCRAYEAVVDDAKVQAGDSADR
jgi:L-malate glycosyltransferase